MTNITNLPKELKETGKFCLWSYETVGGKQTKVPYNPRTGGKAQSTNPDTFADLNFTASRSNGYSGIGMGVFGDFVGIDIDHCVSEGKLSPMAQDIVNICQTYTEISPSGTGLRLIGKKNGAYSYDRKRFYLKNPTNGLEVYVAGDTNRFLTLTGNSINTFPVVDITENLGAVLDKYMVRPNKATGRSAQKPTETNENKRKPTGTSNTNQQTAVSVSDALTDSEVVEKALISKCGEAFRKLYNGDCFDYGHSDADGTWNEGHSEADQAFCNMLAFWCHGDKVQMDRIFRQSGLYREKWDRDDYRNSTLDNAVASCTSFYERSTAKNGKVNHDNDEVKLKYRVLKDGSEVVEKTTSNIVLAIENDPELKGHIFYNTMAYTPCIMGTLPWKADARYREWTNTDDANLRSYLEEKYGFDGRDKVCDALTIVCDRYKMNPVTKVLNQMHENWDGQTGHIRRLLVEYLGCEDSDYHYEVMKMFMLGAIKRAYKPGTKFDYMMIIVGEQGIGKSEFLIKLSIMPEWYCDLKTIEGDTAIEKIRGIWIAEMGELLAMKLCKDDEKIKSFITDPSDNYRPKYERRTERRPRTCVFAGTTNRPEFLTDKTGNRRFLPIEARINKRTKDLFSKPEEVKHDFSQAWGEAMAIYTANPDVEMVLPNYVAGIALEQQSTYMIEDCRIGMIQKYFDDNPEIDKVCAGLLYNKALGEVGRVPRKDAYEITQIMLHEIKGWERANTPEHKMRFPVYGPQKAFTKVLNEGFITDTDD